MVGDVLCVRHVDPVRGGAGEELEGFLVCGDCDLEGRFGGGR